jgi:hypothetical protein
MTLGTPRNDRFVLDICVIDPLRIASVAAKFLQPRQVGSQ